MKKLLSLLVVLGVFLFTSPIMAADIQVLVDGQAVVFKDQSPFIDKDNRTQVPLRAAMEALGCKVSWDADSKQAIIEKDGTKVVFTIGSKIYTVNGVKKTMDTTAVIAGNRTCIPIRYAAEAIGAEVEWVGNKKTVAIYTKSVTPEQKEEIKQDINNSKPGFTVTTESIPQFNRDNITIYRTNSLPIDTGETTILALEHKVIDGQREKLLITVDRAETLNKLMVFFGKDRSNPVPRNNRTGYVYWDKRDKNGNYVLEIDLKTPAGEALGDRINISTYDEIGFETFKGEVYYLKNPFKK